MKINLPIHIKKLTKKGGWYYPFKCSKKKGPLIEINDKLSLMGMIELLSHEFTHFLVDSMDFLPIKSNNVKNSKVVPLNRLTIEQEEKLAEEIRMFVSQKFCDYFIN